MSGVGRRLGGRLGRALRPAVAVLLVALVAGACDAASASQTASNLASATAAPSRPAPSASSEIALTVLADASLTEVAPALVSAYAAVAPGVKITLTFGASSALAVSAGTGSADVLLASDADGPGAIVDAGSALGDASPYATNQVALVVPKGSKKVTKLADLAKAKVSIAAAPADDPCAVASEELLKAASKVKGMPKAYVASVHKNTANRADDVRAALASVTGGSADAAFVWASDAASAGDAVTTIAIPDAVAVTVPFAGVVLNKSASGDAASAFLGWVSGPAGEEILVAAGFGAPSE